MTACPRSGCNSLSAVKQLNTSGHGLGLWQLLHWHTVPCLLQLKSALPASRQGCRLHVQQPLPPGTEWVCAVQISIDGHTDISFTEDVQARYDALGWHTQHIKDGNTDMDSIRKAVEEAKKVTDKPSLIRVRPCKIFWQQPLPGCTDKYLCCMTPVCGGLEDCLFAALAVFLVHCAAESWQQAAWPCARASEHVLLCCCLSRYPDPSTHAWRCIHAVHPAFAEHALMSWNSAC